MNDDPLNVLLYTIPFISHRELEHEESRRTPAQPPMWVLRGSESYPRVMRERFENLFSMSETISFYSYRVSKSLRILGVVLGRVETGTCPIAVVGFHLVQSGVRRMCPVGEQCAK